MALTVKSNDVTRGRKDVDPHGRLRAVTGGSGANGLRAQIAFYELKGDLSPVMLKEIFHDNCENFEIARNVWKTIQA